MQERLVADRRSEWNFVITDEGWLWAVTRSDGTKERSSTGYQTLKQAGDDAMGHGYGAWKADERRAGERRDMDH